MNKLQLQGTSSNAVTKINSSDAIKYIIVLSGSYQTLLTALVVPDGLSLLKVLITLLLLLSGFFLIVFFSKMRGRLSSEFSFYSRTVYSILLAWSIVVIVRSASFNSQDLFTLFGNNQVGWVWLAPLAIVFGLRIEILISLIYFLLRLCAISMVVFFVFLLFLPESFALSLKNIFSTSIFLFLISNYLSSLHKSIVLGGISCLLVISYMESIRINFAVVLAASCFIILMHLFHRSPSIVNNLVKKIVILFGVVLVSLALVELSNTLKSNEIMVQDTRTFLFIELFSDMSSSEQIIGRGALGRYYSPFFEYWNEIGNDGDSENRLTVEVGYLKMILKGGIVLVILYLMLLIPASCQGIFGSNNFLVRACGFYILTYLIFWTISLTPGYLPSFLILWIAAGTCLSKKARMLTDKDVRFLFAQMRMNPRRIKTTKWARITRLPTK